MSKQLYIAACVMVALLLIGLTAADISVSRQVTALLAEAGKNASQLAEQWTSLKSERMETLVFAVLFMGLVLLLVLKIGPSKKTAEGISQEKALQIAAELEDDYRSKGIYVEAKDDDEEEVITEMQMPKMKAARYEGDKVVVEWTNVPNATGYYVWRKCNDEDWYKMKKIKRPVCRYVDKSIEPHTRYVYAVKSYYEDEKSRIISKKDPLGLDVYVPEVRGAHKAEKGA